MKGHEVQDAAWMASAGVDYLKVDDMSGQPRTAAGAYADYATIRDALNKTGTYAGIVFGIQCMLPTSSDLHL